MGIYFESGAEMTMGTFPLKADELKDAVRVAYETGFRSFDTAQMYQNEADLGAALADIGADRDELFITTKILPANLGTDRFIPSAEQSLQALRLDYVDVLLVHWPSPDIENEEALSQLQLAHEKGLAKHIGISNYTIAMMEQAAALLDAPIACNQVEFHPYLDQTKLKAAADRLGVSLSAYCPLAKGQILDDPVIAEIAQRYARPPSQIVLRWILQNGVSANPMSTKKANLESNRAALDFSLSGADMHLLDQLGSNNLRIVDKQRMPIAPDWD